jgi:hypothetical protein
MAKETTEQAMHKLREARKQHVMTSADYSSYGAYDSPTWNMRLVGACPHCKERGNIEIKEQRFEEHGTWGILPVSCGGCGAAWDMRFVLDGFEFDGEDGKYDIEEEEG